MDLSVVIPCFNAASTIGVQLGAVTKQNWSGSWEVVVVDNRSTDRSMAIVEQFRKQLPNLRIVEAPERLSRPYARNVGVAAAASGAVAFCDADDEVGPGWVKAMGDALGQAWEFVACRIDMEKLNPPWVFEALGSHPQQHGVPEIWYPPYLPHAGGGTLGVRRRLHDAVGGFDESLFVLEDTDYCFRIQRLGVTLRFVGDAVVHVRARSNLTGLFRQSACWAESNVALYKKYRPEEPTEMWRYRRHLRGWIGVLRSVPRIRNRTGLARWVWQLGGQVGRLKGTLKYRVPPV
jgi:GT2 family glycosyltransferase